MRSLFRLFALLALTTASCDRPELPESTHREVVSAFHTGVTALQTSQGALAREKFTRVTELAPMEPAGWADLGVLEMRQGNLEAAQPLLERARELAPESAAIERLLGVCASQQGRLRDAVAHWERALSLDPESLEAAFALARETERLGEPDSDAEAQRVLESLLERSDNLAARLELARIAAKRGDMETLASVVAPLDELASTWPPEAREQLQTLTESLTQGAQAAAPRVMFLRNVLLRVPQFRRALGEVTRDGAAFGEPLTSFLALDNPPPSSAPRDETITFSVRAVEELSSGAASWASAIFVAGDAPPVTAAVADGELRLASGARIPFPGEPGAEGVAPADFDYDFRTDLVLAGSGGVRFFRQSEEGGFVDVTASTGLQPELLERDARGVWAADVDTDGDLDVVLATSSSEPLVLRNNGDGSFTETMPFAGVWSASDFAWFDLDGEGVPDAAILEESGEVRVFRNLRGGELRELELPPSVAPSLALAVAEASGDTVLDLLALTSEGSILRIAYDETEAALDVVELARASAGEGSAKLIVADLDNNGAKDLVVAGSDRSDVLLGGAAGFTSLGEVELSARAAVDLDRDGRLDLVGIGAEGGAVVATSRGERAYRWLTIQPRATSATGDQRINSYGIGGEIGIRTGLHFQKTLIDVPSVHFGLGEDASAEVVRIGWPNGVLQSEFEVAADTTVLATQRLKGSCPWLFTWNGSEMAFVTDLLWRSPLGLRINAQETADVVMTEDRVKVRGDQLVPREGHYDLRVTSELWETQFFDRIYLMVVDHPVGTEVFIDERFAVPPPSLEARATGPVGEMSAAWDDSGQDVSDVVRARDGRHLDFAGRGAYQGVTRDHFVTVELSDEAPREGPLWLVAQGWVHPTDSSINLALSQGDHPAPRGLSLLVDDGGGDFRLVREGLGFPAGKEKTLLFDLTGVFPSGNGPRRLRLSTNLEVYWDRLGWAAGRPEVALETRTREAAVAELRYRGFSVVEQTEPSSPERPLYEIEGIAPRWRDLEGYHTRFGDVKELLREVDDRYVIMNAGDEIVLRFAEAPPLAPGWVRDFVVVSDGWVKDGDFNTTFSRTVLPLPTHESASYETAPGPLEDDPVYREHPRDFETYHTRYVTPERVRDALEPPGSR